MENILKDLMKNNPEQFRKAFISQNKGKTSKGYCPVCKKETSIKVFEDGTLKCLECDTEVDFKTAILNFK